MQVGLIVRGELLKEKKKKRCGDSRLRALPRQRPGFVEGLGGWVGMKRLRRR